MKAELDELLALLDQRFRVDALWVFGSQAAGRAREDSDLDVAVLFEERPSAVELVELEPRRGTREPCTLRARP